MVEPTKIMHKKEMHCNCLTSGCPHLFGSQLSVHPFMHAMTQDLQHWYTEAAPLTAGLVQH